jgi:hypothetical protein
MMPFDKINRRTHLYAALFFLPWFFVYGVSSAVFSHPAWFNRGPMEWTLLSDREYHLDVPPAEADLRPAGLKILNDSGASGQFVVLRNPQGHIQVNQGRFLSVKQYIYDPQSKRLAVRTDQFRWSSLLTRLHARGGFEAPGFLQNLWSVLVDLVQIGIMIWMASGIYMWWHLKRLRKWGFVALGGGVLSFAVFLLGL